MLISTFAVGVKPDRSATVMNRRARARRLSSRLTQRRVQELPLNHGGPEF